MIQIQICNKDATHVIILDLFQKIESFYERCNLNISSIVYEILERVNRLKLS